MAFVLVLFFNGSADCAVDGRGSPYLFRVRMYQVLKRTQFAKRIRNSLRFARSIAQRFIFYQ
jgi:hypothetical protein